MNAASPAVLGVTTSAGVGAALLSSPKDVALAGRGQALEALLPVIVRVLGEAGAGLDDIGLIAVDVGPGSFTGLRIGVSFATALAQALALGLVGVSAYDIAELQNRDAFPRIAVVAGKPDYYYVRLRTSPDAPAEFMHGESAELRERIGRIVTPPSDLAQLVFADGPGERARGVAQLGKRLADRGAVTDWRRIAIDYGQRPNAVVNWEARRDKGAPRQASKHRRR